MKKIHLIMPMGGAGSRFSNNGYNTPKPLININGYPFLYWSTMSIAKYVDLKDITFIVLKEHIYKYKIDKEIKKYFKNAKIIVLDKMLNGAVLTCLRGVSEIDDNYPIVFNDCDHLFRSNSFNEYLKNGNFDLLDGALLTFESSEPKYSFLMLDENENVVKTVEKEVVSNYAICGAYYFKNKEIFLEMANLYLTNCKYSEYYLSGIYNEMAKCKKIIKAFNVDYHLPFGTPEEYNDALNSEYFKDLI